jgi:hypothetical protein
MEETAVPVVRKSVEKSGSRKGLSRFVHTSTSTRSKYKDKDKDKDEYKDKDKDKINDEVYDKDKDNGQLSRVDATRVGMVAGQLMEKLEINALQKKTSRSATTRIIRSNGQDQ